MDMQTWLGQNIGGRYGNYIDGEWEQAGPDAVAITNPARRDQVLGHFAEGTAEDADRAVSSSHRAWKAWREVPGPERGAILFRAAELLEKRAEEFAFLVSAEQGKILAESRGEVGRAVKELRFAAGEASRMEGWTLPSEKRNGLAMTFREPVGVIASIAPWNFPVLTPVRKIGPALAYGCTTVLKPSNFTPWCSVRLVELFKEAGVPKGVINLVLGSGRTVGEALVKHPLVRGISFTGSTRTGGDINAQAGRRMVRTQLEMGGKNPAVVLSYADAANIAKQIAQAAFTTTGQRCTAVSRVIVLQSLAAELGEALVAELAAIKVGPAWDPASRMGPLVTDQHRASVLRNMASGLDQGARIRFGGRVLEDGELGRGNFLEPALIENVSPENLLAKQEVFGPVLSLISVRDANQAIEVANSVEYGLAASVFTRDVDEALRFVRESESGMVHVNHGTNSEAHMPFGGVKGSGLGAYSIGHSNLEFFTNVKAAYFQG
ncbi:MAG: aldehyde dehydrogenase [Xanthomonadales bacterium]|mgnify:CR=1 FL=1|jgi:acyl-CoA reductase-like NAD-dependent aldehyde dehydrogenase|nr:aldehyde dehydrogenase [Rubrivivax sp.]MBP7418560.1 aldehyde dehydrogenase [Xanthomonadales bacterium]